MYFPRISIIIATLNSGELLKRCLRSLRKQNYPPKNIEIILVDGGSTDKTLTIGRKYNCRILAKSKVKSEAAKAYGLQVAKGELVADFAADNVLPEKDWLRKAIQPLLQEKEIVASYPLWYHYLENESIFNRYVALFGVNDPVPLYLGKADRQGFFEKDYQLAGRLVKKGKNYFIVEFNPDNLPTVGANGFIIRKKLLKKAKVSPAFYFHIDVVYDLVKMGYNKFAVCKTSIIHKTADNFFTLLTKRSRYFQNLYLKQKKRRRYHLVSKKDYPNLIVFSLFSLTFLQPLLVSLKGYLKKKDLAWFAHPFFCFLITLVYTKEVIKNCLRINNSS